MSLLVDNTVVLIDPGNTFSQFSQNRYVNRGLLSIGSFLLQKKISVDYILFEELDYDFKILSEKIAGLIKEKKVLLFGISMMSINESDVYFRLIEEINSVTEIPILAGGYYATFFYKELIDNLNIDYIIRGEGELATYMLIRSIINSDGFNDVSGLAYKSGGDILLNSMAYIPSLEQIAPIDYSLLPINYLLSPHPPNINLEFNRGCLNNCFYCSVKYYYPKGIRKIPLGHLISEVKQLNNLNYKGSISIEDGTVYLNDKDFVTFLKEISDIKFSGTYDYITTSHSEISYESAELISNSGFKACFLGLDSVDQNVLKINNRKIDISKLKASCEILRLNNIKIYLFIVVGLPGDNEDALNKTYNFVMELLGSKLLDRIFVSYFLPIPNTKSTKLISKYNGQILKNANLRHKWIYRDSPLVEYDILKENRIKYWHNKFMKLNPNDNLFINKF